MFVLIASEVRLGEEREKKRRTSRLRRTAPLLTSAELDIRDAMLCASLYVGAPCFLGIGNCTPKHGIIQTHLDDDSRELGSTFPVPVFNHQLG
jgi:hypothetical protein